MTRVWNYAYLFVVGSVVLAIDQYTKFLVRTNLAFGETWMPIEWLNPYVRFVYTTNTGSACGLFQGGSYAFTLIAILVIGVILFYYRHIPRGQGLIRLVLGLQLGGALGNLVDRLAYGTVTDFVSLGRFAVFNVADASISVGVALLSLLMMREEWQAVEAEGSTAPEIRKRRANIVVGTAGVVTVVLLFFYLLCWARR